MATDLVCAASPTAPLLTLDRGVRLLGPLTKRAGVRLGVLVAKDLQYDIRERRSRTALSVSVYFNAGRKAF
jgi:hypothetical protein